MVKERLWPDEFHDEAMMLKNLLTHPAAYHITQRVAYNIGLFGNLTIRSVEDGRFAVRLDEKKEESLYYDVDEAIAYFLKLREELHIGYDYEGNAVEDREHSWLYHGEVTSFDTITCYGRIKCGDAIYEFPSTAFIGTRPIFPEAGDKVEFLISKETYKVKGVRQIKMYK